MSRPKHTASKSPARMAIVDQWNPETGVGPVACLCFDLGSHASGYAAVTDRLMPAGFGVYRCDNKAEGDRAGRLIESVLSCCRFYRPALVVAEITKGIRYGLKSRSTDLATLARVQGRIVQAVADAGFKVEPVHDVTWTKGAAKAARAARMRLTFPEYARWAGGGHDEGLDAADALGLASWWHGQVAARSLIARGGK